MSDRNDQWSWDGVNAPYGGELPTPATQPTPPTNSGQYGPAPSPYGGGPSPYGDPAATPPASQHPPYPGQPQYPGQPPNPGQSFPTGPPASYSDQLAWNRIPHSAQFSAGSLKPGIIALRPLNFGEFFDGAFRSIQHNPQVMFGLSLAVAVVLSLIEVILMGGAVLGLGSDFDPDFPIGIGASSLFALSGGAVIASIFAVIATIVLNGLLVVSVSQSILGRKVSISEVWKQSKGVIHRLVGVTFMVSALTLTGVIIALTAAALLVFGVSSTLDESSWIIILLLFVLVMAMIAALSAFFYVRFGLAAPAIVMERATAFQAMGRSWRLTQGFFWRNGFVLVLGTMIAGAISGIFSVPISMIAMGVGSLGDAGLWAMGIITVALSALLSALTTPFIAALSALLYVDLRMRKEGLDVELIRASSS